MEWLPADGPQMEGQFSQNGLACRGRSIDSSKYVRDEVSRGHRQEKITSVLRSRDCIDGNKIINASVDVFVCPLPPTPSTSRASSEGGVISFSIGTIRSPSTSRKSCHGAFLSSVLLSPPAFPGLSQQPKYSRD